MSGASVISSTAEVDRYLAEADSLKYADYQRLLTVAGLAASRAQSLGDFRRYARALVHQAWAYGNLFQYEPSLTYALEALVMARTHGFVDIEARAVNVIGLDFIQCGIRHEAERLYEHQLELGQRLNDGELQSMALHDFALVRMSEGNFEQAAEILGSALPLMPHALHEGLDHSVIHGNLSLAYIEVGRLDEALSHAQESLILAQQAESVALVGNAHTILASAYERRGEIQDAYAQLERARECIDSSEPTGLASNVELIMAQILAREGRHEEALASWERSYDIAVRGHMLDSAVTILRSIKEAYQGMNDMAGVVSAFERLEKDIPRLQERGSDLRFTVLRMVFALDKAAAAHAEMQLTRQKNAVLQRLSHEFRTPLTIIQSTAELVEKYGDRLTLAQRQERLQRISGQVKWMTVMLEDIVELLKLDEADDSLYPAVPFQLDDLARGALAGIERYRMPSTVVRVEAQAEAGILNGAQKVLETVAVHLLTNAIKFSENEVTLALSVEGRTLVMSVADQGIGILPEEQAAIFQPLVRGSNLDEVTGTGLGLAIVAKLVDQMHGTISLASVEGKGTTVTVRVPLS